jgi:hypothetical protein
MVTILWYVNGQEQKFKDARKITALPESLVFPQIKKTAWMGGKKRKLVLRQHSLKSFSGDLSTVLHHTKQVKTDEWKTGCHLPPETLFRHHVVIIESHSDVAVMNHSSMVPVHYMH